MASLVRQPFAPLDSTRLQNLTSIKNRQNALSTSPPTKRKAADVLDPADFENLDPSLFKRSKGDKPSAKGLSSFFPNKEIYKSAIVLTEKPSTTVNAPVSTPLSPLKSVSSPRRQILNPKSPSKLGSVFAKSSPLTTPAGRSPPRSKRAGILGSSRRRSSTYSRIDPPKYGSPTPFSLDAALKGTIPSYAARASSSLATAASISAGSVSKASSKFTSLDEPAMKGEWFFDIHEDTPEQEMTNMLQHSTCTLDISSDEESEQKQRREHDEGRDKENIPPPDDISQTRRRLADSANAIDDENAMMVEKIVARQALADLDASDYWAEGCDSESVFVVPGDEDAETVIDENEVLPHLDEQPRNFEFSQRESVSATYLEPIVEVNSSFESKLDEPVAIFEDQSIPQSEQLDIPTLDQIIDAQPTVEELMMGPFQQKPAAVLEPVEGTTAGESFEVWESGSAKDENEPPSPVEVEVQA